MPNPRIFGVLTDKIRSKLHKRYKNETRLDPWIKSETFESPQIKKDTDNYILQDSMAETQVKIPNKTRLYQYAIEHKMDPEKFSVITEAEKNRWAMRSGKTDRLRRGILKSSGLSTAWLDDLMKEWEEIYAQFIQMFSPNEIGIEITTKSIL
ncbi:hypothetical protein Glove_9g66 [Diversispora epigaea]|uniref:Uncharacterized protein n=1 Tax=Diversispora epigaea TaxID=1348612 RepID=A0A397JZW3_9GLOM|nr:hypothetical protein Glove_9g66 [Diversispora epigaea]